MSEDDRPENAGDALPYVTSFLIDMAYGTMESVRDYLADQYELNAAFLQYASELRSHYLDYAAKGHTLHESFYLAAYYMSKRMKEVEEEEFRKEIEIKAKDRDRFDK